MSTLKNYKKMENGLFARFGLFVKRTLVGVGTFFRRVWKAGRQKMTIMFVPHSEKSVFNLQVSVFNMFAAIFLVGIVLFAFVVFAARDTMYTSESLANNERIKQQQANEDTLRTVTGELLETVRTWQLTLTDALEPLGINLANNDPKGGGGDLSGLYGRENAATGELKEFSEIVNATKTLKDSLQPIKDLAKLIANNQVTMREIPNIWPIKGGIGHVSMYYGQNENPFTGQWYIHTGIDFSTYRVGDPIVATADGKVIYAGYQWGFGNYVIVQHSHGFYTRYAHMQMFAVNLGDKVRQGQVIGYIGNTGITTGPHLHYEVIYGTDIIDPLPYLNLRSTVIGERR